MFKMIVFFMIFTGVFWLHGDDDMHLRHISENFTSMRHDEKVAKSRYIFLLNRLYDQRHKNNESVVRKLTQSASALVIGCALSYALLTLPQIFNVVDNLPLSWPVKMALRGLLKMVDVNVWITLSMAIAGGLASYPYIDRVFEQVMTHRERDPIDALNDLVRRWPDYRMCMPEQFFNQFEILFLMFHANRKKLPGHVLQLDLVIEVITAQLADVLCSDIS